MKCFESSQAKVRVLRSNEIENEFRNWNPKYFIIDWEMTLTLFFLSIETLQFAAAGCKAGDSCE
jgi:hypothetical protein